MCLYVNDSPRPSDFYRLEISSRFTVNFLIRSPMFYTRTCHFPLFAAVKRWLFAISAHSVVLSTICRSCTTYRRKERGDSRRSMTYARDSTTPLLLSGFRALRSFRSALHICTITRMHTLDGLPQICTYVSEIFAHAHDVHRDVGYPP